MQWFARWPRSCEACQRRGANLGIALVMHCLRRAKRDYHSCVRGEVEEVQKWLRRTLPEDGEQ